MSSTPESQPSGSVWASPLTLWSTILLVAVVVVAIVLAIGSTMQPQTEGAPVSTNAPPASNNTDSVCGLEAGDQSIPTTTAPETTWVLVGTTAAPDSPDTYGPGVEQNGQRSCYAQSPVGGLYFAANFYAQGGTPELALENIENNVAPGAGRDQILKDWDGTAGTSGGTYQFVGYQVLEYGDGKTVVDLAVRLSTGVLASLVTELVWLDGDWKFVVQDNGQVAVPLRQIETLSGYVPWNGA